MRATPLAALFSATGEKNNGPGRVRPSLTPGWHSGLLFVLELWGFLIIKSTIHRQTTPQSVLIGNEFAGKVGRSWPLQNMTFEPFCPGNHKGGGKHLGKTNNVNKQKWSIYKAREEEEKLIKSDLSYYRNNKLLDRSGLTNKSPIHLPITWVPNSTMFWESFENFNLQRISGC